MHPPVRPDLSCAKDYRRYLKEMFVFLKAKRKGVSYRSLSLKLQVSSGYLKHILEGRRHLTTSRILPVARVFALQDHELDLFTMLVVRDITADPSSKAHFTKILDRLRANVRSPSTHFQTIRDDRQRFLTGDWLASAILELAKFDGFRANAAWIRSHLIDGSSTLPDEIEATLGLLRRKKLLVEKEGRLLPAPPPHSRPDPFDLRAFEVYREAVGKTHEILGAPDKYKNCYFLANVTAVDKATEEKIIAEFSRYRERITELADACAAPDRVLLVSNNLATLGKRSG